MVRDKYNQDENDLEDFEDFQDFYGLDNEEDGEPEELYFENQGKKVDCSLDKEEIEGNEI